jgi:hypothetical protein
MLDKPALMQLLLTQPTFGPWLKQATAIQVSETETELLIVMPPLLLEEGHAHLLMIRARIYQFLLQHAYDLAVTVQRADERRPVLA